MNRLVMTITSDDLAYLEMIDAETENYCDHERRVTSYTSIIASADDEATFGVPPDGETVADVAEEKRFVESGKINATPFVTRISVPQSNIPNTTVNITSRIISTPVYAQPGESITAEHYNQLLGLLLEIRESLWEFQTRQTSHALMRMNAVPIAEVTTSNQISSKDVSAALAEKQSNN